MGVELDLVAETGGLVEWHVLKDTAPQHVEYSLTGLGKTPREPLAAICAWVAAHQGN
ncbi:MAG TPA: winged helix-turn-helix transcriptional regulator [Pseudonocardiaceae bacterium]|nr:winged helix-turn-helix transcriptional regulator [Pseudonocardiaceae bacterium]